MLGERAFPDLTIIVRGSRGNRLPLQADQSPGRTGRGWSIPSSSRLHPTRLWTPACRMLPEPGTCSRTTLRLEPSRSRRCVTNWRNRPRTDAAMRSWLPTRRTANPRFPRRHHLCCGSSRSSAKTMDKSAYVNHQIAPSHGIGRCQQAVSGPAARAVCLPGQAGLHHPHACPAVGGYQKASAFCPGTDDRVDPAALRYPLCYDGNGGMLGANAAQQYMDDGSIE